MALTNSAWGKAWRTGSIMPLTTAFAIAESFGLESGVNKRLGEAPAFYGIFTVILAIGAVVVMVPGLDPVGAIVSSQYLQGLFLPIILAFIVQLASSERLLGVHASPRWLRMAGWGAVALLAAPLAWQATTTLFREYEARTLVKGNQGTIMLQAAFGLLMAVGMGASTLF